MMKIKQAENMYVNCVVKVSLHQTVWKSICLPIVISKDFLVIFVENNWRMILVIEDIWFVYMDKSSLVKYVTKIFQPLMASICTKEKFMVLCTKSIIIFVQNKYSWVFTAYFEQKLLPWNLSCFRTDCCDLELMHLLEFKQAWTQLKSSSKVNLMCQVLCLLTLHNDCITSTGLQGNCLDITPHLSYLNFSHNNAS